MFLVTKLRRSLSFWGGFGDISRDDDTIEMGRWTKFHFEKVKTEDNAWKFVVTKVANLDASRKSETKRSELEEHGSKRHGCTRSKEFSPFIPKVLQKSTDIIATAAYRAAVIYAQLKVRGFEGSAEEPECSK